jgi:hypothetical protein
MKPIDELFIEIEKDGIMRSHATLLLDAKKQYGEMLERLNWLSCLEEAGVDNWEGTEYAYEALKNSRNK